MDLLSIFTKPSTNPIMSQTTAPSTQTQYQQPQQQQVQKPNPFVQQQQTQQYQQPQQQNSSYQGYSQQQSYQQPQQQSQFASSFQPVQQQQVPNQNYKPVQTVFAPIQPASKTQQLNEKPNNIFNGFPQPAVHTMYQAPVQVQVQQQPQQQQNIVQKGDNINVATYLNKLLARNGPKNGKSFVDDLTNAFNNNLTGDALIPLYMCSKKFAFRGGKELFDSEYAKSIEASNQALIARGQSPDDIAKSGPRISRVSQYEEMSLILPALWNNVKDKKSCTWGTLYQVPKFKEFCDQVNKTILKTVKPVFQAGLYTKTFWSTITFDQGLMEVRLRLHVLYTFGLHVSEMARQNALKIDARGNVTVDGNTLFPVHVSEGDKQIQLSDDILAQPSSDIFQALCGYGSYGAIIYVAIMVDPKRLMMCSDYRQNRKRNITKHTEQQKNIAECIRILHAIVDMIKNDGRNRQSIKPNLDMDSEFVKMHWESYEYLHTVIRTLKRQAFGGSSGPNTRIADDGEFDISDASSILNKWNIGSEKGQLYQAPNPYVQGDQTVINNNNNNNVNGQQGQQEFIQPEQTQQ